MSTHNIVPVTNMQTRNTCSIDLKHLLKEDTARPETTVEIKAHRDSNLAVVVD